MTGIEGPAESSKTYLGKYASGSYWIGAIDEAGIWDRALSSMEIEQLYNMGNGIIARKANTEDQDLVLEAKGYWYDNGSCYWKWAKNWDLSMAQVGAPAMVVVVPIQMHATMMR